MAKVLPRFKTKIKHYQLTPASNGEFEITLDGKPIYSKLQAGGFPDEADVLARLEQHVS